MALQKLRDFYQGTNPNTFNDMLKSRVVVTEKIAGASFHVRRAMEGFEYFKSGNNEAMNIIDRTLTSVYENAIKHFQSLTLNEKNQMPSDWKFGFEYLPEANMSSIEYDSTPFNFMILTHIQVLGTNGKAKKVLTDPKVLKEWAQKLQVQGPSIVFDGMLNEDQKRNLVTLLSMSNESYAKRFGNEAFTNHVYKLFNPGAYKTVLNEDLVKPIDGLIVSFVDSTQIKSFKLEEFKPANEAETSNREASHMYQITMVDLLEFFSTVDLDSIELLETASDKRYIELISAMYNSYVKENATKYVGVDFGAADFSKSALFNINTKYIDNEKTLEYLDNPVLAELYKIMLSSFSKKKIKESALLNSNILEQLNQIIDVIEQKVFVENADENAIHNFNNFLMHNKISASKTNMNEALKINYSEQGKEKVNMFVGRFQPFTLGHAKVLETIHKQNGYPVVVFLVKAAKAQKDDAVKRPFDTETQIQMFMQVQKQYPFLKEIFVIPSAGIDLMFNEMRPKYEPVLWGTGTDRFKTYGYQVNNDKYRDELGVLPEFGLYEIKRDDEDISATKVREALLANDKKTFDKMTPKALGPLFNELKQKLETSLKISEAVETEASADVLTFEQFKLNTNIIK
jgi:cytidyltransferase-like protein